MQKNNITILSTGFLNKEIVDTAFDLDVIVDIIPFIETKLVATATLQKIVEPLIHQHASIIVTSSNAAEALAESVRVNLPGWRFFCVGNATSSTIRKYFGASAITVTADNAKELARQIYDYGVQEEMIFFCGDQRRNELPDSLRANGIRLKEVVVYETIPTPQKLAKQYEGILFFSPSAVQSFFSLNQVDTETVLFTIGSTTAEALQAYTKNKIVIADKPDKDEVVNTAIEYFKQ